LCIAEKKHDLIKFRQRAMKIILKKILKKIGLFYPIFNWLSKRRQLKELETWEKGDRTFPPPHIIKQRAIKEYAARYGCKIFVETGTFLGDMVEAMKDVFTQIYSIELSNELCNDARLRFKGLSHIEIISGDSGDEIKNLICKIHEPALFWLDGHYSGGPTARGKKDTPIFEELTHILKAPSENKHVIIIDDARCFGKDPSYPTLEELGNFIKSHRQDLEITVKDDSVRIVAASC